VVQGVWLAARGGMGSAECGKGPYERVRGQGETGGGAGRLCNTVVNGNGQ